MISALSLYENGLRNDEPPRLVRPCGRRQDLPMRVWAGEISRADQVLLSHCDGPTLDVGCGPGRLTTALTNRGGVSLGIDVSAVAVRMTQRRGGLALQRNVFAVLPGTGRWGHLLLADGNIGIGGDPVRLLRRCRELLSPLGTVLIDLQPPGAGLLIERIRLEASGSISAPFRWCWVGVDAVLGIAMAAGLVTQEVWRVEDRWQARLGRPA